jgi:hypothetical protein
MVSKDTHCEDTTSDGLQGSSKRQGTSLKMHSWKGPEEVRYVGRKSVCESVFARVCVYKGDYTCVSVSVFVCVCVCVCESVCGCVYMLLSYSCRQPSL